MPVSPRARKRLEEISLLRAQRQHERAELYRAVSTAEMRDIRLRIGILDRKIDGLLTGRAFDQTRVVWLER